MNMFFPLVTLFPLSPSSSLPLSPIFNIYLFYCMHMNVLPALCICNMFLPGTLWGQKRSLDALGLELANCEPTCRCRRLNPGPPQEQQVLLTTEPPTQQSPLSILVVKINVCG